MSVSILERPHQFSFSENEIRYIFFVDDSLAPGCAVDIEIRYMPLDQTEDIPLVTVSPVPDATGHIYFHLRHYLKSILAPQMPDPGGVFTQRVTDQIKYFYIRYKEVTKAAPLPAWIDDKLNKKVVLMGGVEQIKFRRNNFFASYIPNYKPFLTWQPSNKMVFVNQDHYLTYLHTTSETGFDMKIRIVFTDGTIVNQSYPYNVGDDFLFRIKAGAQQLFLNLIDQTKTLYYYEISIVSGSTILANPFRFYLEYNHFYQYHDFNYINSLGGVDSARLKGDFDWSLDITNDDIERVRDKEQAGSPFPVSQYGQSNILKKDNYKGDIGWSKTPLQQEVLIELIMSKGIFENIDGRWIGVLNLKKSQSLRSNSDKKWSFPLEWSYGYSDHVFTPKAVILGISGQYVAPPDAPPTPIDNSCVAVGLPGGAALPDGTVGVFYDYSFNFTGTAPFGLTNIVKPTWMTVALSGSAVHFSGMPTVDGPGIVVSFTVSNCSANTLNFSDSFIISAQQTGPARTFTIVNMTTTDALVIAVNNILYPEIPAGGQSAAVPLSSSIAIASSSRLGTSMTNLYNFDFVTTVNGTPVYSTHIITGESIYIDPALFPSIGYLQITAVS